MGLISGLAAACFAKAFGIVFLGSPRSAGGGRSARGCRTDARAAMAILALLCIAIWPCRRRWSCRRWPCRRGGERALTAQRRQPPARPDTGPLTIAVSVFAVLIGIAAFAWSLARPLLGRAGVRQGTGLGVRLSQHPTPRMQYTASSFAQPLTTQFRSVCQQTVRLSRRRAAIFPTTASYSSDSGDPFLRLLFAPTFRRFNRSVEPAEHRSARARPSLRPLCRRHPDRAAGLGQHLSDARTPLAFVLAASARCCWHRCCSGSSTKPKPMIAGRRGQPLLQPYRDIAKYLRRGAVYGDVTSWVFRLGPVVNLAALVGGAADYAVRRHRMRR